jgi:hypothetical protein
MNSESRVLRNTQTAYRSVDGEGLIMNPTDSSLHSLNAVAGAIWEYLSEERRVADIVAKVMEDFECERETAERDVGEFLEALQQKHLVKIL